MTKQINTGVAELLLVKVPDDAQGFRICNGPNYWISYMHSIQLHEHINHYMGELELVEIPKGNYELLGIAHELTEKVWATIVEHTGFHMGLPTYKDYGTTDLPYYGTSATESGLSLLRANEVFNKNPYGIDPYGLVSPVCGETCSCVVGCYQAANYDDAQQNTGKWVLLKKIEG